MNLASGSGTKSQLHVCRYFDSLKSDLQSRINNTIIQDTQLLTQYRVLKAQQEHSREIGIFENIYSQWSQWARQLVYLSNLVFFKLLPFFLKLIDEYFILLSRNIFETNKDPDENPDMHMDFIILMKKICRNQKFIVQRL